MKQLLQKLSSVSLDVVQISQQNLKKEVVKGLPWAKAMTMGNRLSLAWILRN